MTIVSKPELQAALGKSRTQIDRLIAKGMPVFQQGSKGKAYEFVLQDCQLWYENFESTEEHAQRVKAMEADVASERDTEIKAAKLRKLNIEADRLELKYQEDLKRVIENEEIGAVYDEQIANVKALILLLPQRMISLIGPDNAEVLKDYIHEILEELSSEAAIDRVTENSPSKEDVDTR